MKDAGNLPEHILKMFNEGGAAGQKRQHQTKVINTLFKRSKDGKLVLNAGDPWFAKYKDHMGHTQMCYTLIVTLARKSSYSSNTLNKV